MVWKPDACQPELQNAPITTGNPDYCESSLVHGHQWWEVTGLNAPYRPRVQ